MVPAKSPIPYQLNGTELLIQQNVNIVGAGARRPPSSSPRRRRSRARVFDIHRTQTRLRPDCDAVGLHNPVRIVTTASTNGAFGGDILDRRDAHVSEDEIILGVTTSGSGGGISNDGGTLMVTHSLVDGNLAVEPTAPMTRARN